MLYVGMIEQDFYILHFTFYIYWRWRRNHKLPQGRRKLRTSLVLGQIFKSNCHRLYDQQNTFPVKYIIYTSLCSGLIHLLFLFVILLFYLYCCLPFVVFFFEYSSPIQQSFVKFFIVNIKNKLS